MSMLSDKSKVGFIGAGKMCQALIHGMTHSGILKNDDIWISAPSMNNLKQFEEIGCNVTHSNEEVLFHCMIVFLCMKPNILQKIGPEMKEWKDNHLVVSVASGITLNCLQQFTPAKTHFIRCVPNTPSAVHAGASAIARGLYTTDDDVKMIIELMRTIGICEEVLESQINAICGLSGSGPAYVYTIIQSMADGGVKMGLPKPLALRFAAQTVMGASKMVLETGEHPEVLRDNVCSPGGTTIAAMHTLEKSGVRAAMMNAVETATLQAAELGKC